MLCGLHQERLPMKLLLIVIFSGVISVISTIVLLRVFGLNLPKPKKFREYVLRELGIHRTDTDKSLIKSHYRARFIISIATFFISLSVLSTLLSIFDR
jgi:hypothetical protein